MMFLSGIFFPIDFMPDWMKTIATLLPLTYLGDGLRQTMVGSSPFVPLGVGMAILAGWLVVCLGISARFFRWSRTRLPRADALSADRLNAPRRGLHALEDLLAPPAYSLVR